MIDKSFSAALKRLSPLLPGCVFIAGMALANISFGNPQDPAQHDDTESLRTYLQQYYQSKMQSLPEIPLIKKIQQKKAKNIRQQYDSLLSKTPKIAIIIDDIGNNKELDLKAANLPGAITLSILPHTPNAHSIAKTAFEKQKEVMLHVPMESINDNKLGEGALTETMNEIEFKQMLQSDIKSIPHVVGLNNHMGSLLTQNENAMSWLMASLKENNLYFVDSRTIASSIASDFAAQYKIDHISRDVFLDHEATIEYTDAAFKKAIRISKKTGLALVIGHPYPGTIDYLEKNLHQLHAEGIELVSVSELIKFKNSVKQKTLPEK